VINPWTTLPIPPLKTPRPRYQVSARRETLPPADSTGSNSGGSTNLELQGTSGQGIPTGGDSGSSSLGSGSGSSTASGDQSQGDVGVAGPDSNRVPESLRDVVKDFFEGPEP
jgi:hypothetical protein